MVRLQRLQYDRGSGSQLKLTNGVQIPLTLDFSQFCNLVFFRSGVEGRMLPWAFRSMNCRVSSNIMEIEHHVDITHVTLETVILSFSYYETIVGSQSMTQMWRKSLVRTSTVGIAIASHVVNEHPWRPCKQPNRSFSVEPVAYHEIGNGDDHHNDPQPTSSSTSSSSPMPPPPISTTTPSSSSSSSCLLGGTTRSRRMATHQATVQSAYMCL